MVYSPSSTSTLASPTSTPLLIAHDGDTACSMRGDDGPKGALAVRPAGVTLVGRIERRITGCKAAVTPTQATARGPAGRERQEIWAFRRSAFVGVVRCSAHWHGGLNQTPVKEHVPALHRLTHDP